MKGNPDPRLQGDPVWGGNVISTTPGIAQIAGLNGEHLTEVTLNGVEIRGVQPDQIRAQFARITIGPLGSNLRFTGNDVTLWIRQAHR